jgi:uncharacterized protein YjbI with pentapeptide repeats
MDPTVVAAIIAGALTVLGTLATQYFGRRGASKDAGKAFIEQREQLSKTFAEQREQLNETLKAQSDQLDRTLAEQRTRTLNERFASAAEQLGSDKPAAVRLAGVYAMAGLADDWEANRQTCVDVLCAYLRMPYEPDPGKDSSAAEQLAFKSSREVRHTVIRVITAHLREHAATSWQGLYFDFTGVVFDGASFYGARFSGGEVEFTGARFSDAHVYFGGAQFCGGEVDFSAARFSGGEIWFTEAQFSGATVSFGLAEFSAWVSFDGAEFSGGKVRFYNAEFRSKTVNFSGARFSGGEVSFGKARFSGGEVYFTEAQFSGGRVSFGGARFSGSRVPFARARFSGAEFYFGGAEFTGGEVDFSEADDWSTPPKFPWTDTPPLGVTLPSPARLLQLRLFPPWRLRGSAGADSGPG